MTVWSWLCGNCRKRINRVPCPHCGRYSTQDRPGTNHGEAQPDPLPSPEEEDE